MCVLHVTSDTRSFAGFLRETAFPSYASHEKGDARTSGERQPYDDFGFSSDVSKRDWTDLAGQIEDAHAFLREHEAVLRSLTATHAISDIRLDFPYSCRLGEGVFAQCDYLAPEFLRLAGELGVGLELSHYPPMEEGEGPGQHPGPVR
ncbi:MAG: hypothetical protein U1E05_22175 [Patescibacteria group bacterium]|nr:hypothetical protein [Patescibacteria group bacterium]